MIILYINNKFCKLWASITKKKFSHSEGEVEAKTGFLQQQVLLYFKYVFGKWISGMCSFLNGNNCL
jgi:hypothetical protein